MGRETLWVGIDPGLSGAIAFIGSRGAHVDDTPTVVVRGKRQVSAPAMVELLDPYGRPELAALGDPDAVFDVRAVIEQVSCRPGQQVVGVLHSGYNAGIWEGILAASQTAYQLVVPQHWKRFAPGGSLIGMEKDASRLRAIQLFPSLAGRLARKKDDGRAEALLLAEWLRRRAR